MKSITKIALVAMIAVMVNVSGVKATLTVVPNVNDTTAKYPKAFVMTIKTEAGTDAVQGEGIVVVEDLGVYVQDDITQARIARVVMSIECFAGTDAQKKVEAKITALEADPEMVQKIIKLGYPVVNVFTDVLYALLNQIHWVVSSGVELRHYLSESDNDEQVIYLVRTTVPYTVDKLLKLFLEFKVTHEEINKRMNSISDFHDALLPPGTHSADAQQSSKALINNNHYEPLREATKNLKNIEQQLNETREICEKCPKIGELLPDFPEAIVNIMTRVKGTLNYLDSNNGHLSLDNEIPNICETAFLIGIHPKEIMERIDEWFAKQEKK